MTIETLNKAMELNHKIEECDEVLKNLNSDAYDHYTVHGVCSDGVSDYIDLLPKEALKALKQWYIDEGIRLREEFKVL